MSADPDSMTTTLRSSRFLIALERLAGWTIPFFAITAVASISLQNVIYLGIFAWIVYMAVGKKWQVVKTPMNWPMILLAGLLILASVVEGRVNGSIFGIRKVGLMLVFFMTVSIARHPLKADRYLNFFLIGAGACALWSVVAHFFGLDSGRARSFSGDYMAAGGMYMLAFIISASRFLHSRQSLSWHWLGLTGLIGLALLLTYTRSSWIAAACALLLLGFLRDWRLPVTLLAVVVLFLLIFPKNPVSERVFSINSKYHSSNVERRYMWVSGFKLLKKRPLRGYGVDNLSEHYGKVAHPKAEEQRPPHVHNTLLQMAINGGLPAAGMYLWWMVVLLFFGLRTWRKLKNQAPERAGSALGITAAMLGFIINGLFEFNFGTSQVITIVYFLSGLLAAFYYSDPKGPVWNVPSKPRVLFLRPRFRGDVLMTSTVARLMKRDYPKATVDLLTEPASVGAANGEPCWDNVLSMPRKGLLAWWRMVKVIRKNDYDMVCDLFGNPRTAVLSFMSGSRFKIGPQVTAWDSFFHYTTKPNKPGPRPAWESYFDILRAFGMKQLSVRPRWEITEEDDLWIRSFLKERKVQPGKIIGLFAGGSHPAKRWPLVNFLEVAKRASKELGMKAIFIFGPLEKDLKMDYMHAEGKLSLSVEGLPPGRLAALWKHCAAVVANDAFPMHVGPAVSTPTIGLFGPSDPDIWFPYPEKSGHHVLHSAPSCWPCHRDVCDELTCWKDITPDRVMMLLKETVTRKQNRKSTQQIKKKTTKKVAKKATKKTTN